VENGDVYYDREELYYRKEEKKRWDSVGVNDQLDS
jgi:hypothetical protein